MTFVVDDPGMIGGNRGVAENVAFVGPGTGWCITGRITDLFAAPGINEVVDSPPACRTRVLQ